MAIYNGPISLIKLFPNSNLNSTSKGLLNNAVASGFNFGVNELLGQELAQKLGFAPTGKSNFLSTIVGPGLISTGVEGLSQLVTTSITNSKALGPFGPLAGSIVNTGIEFLGNTLTEQVFNLTPKGALDTAGTPNIYFPGAGGEGEGDANFVTSNTNLLGGLLGGDKTRKQPYSIGKGGPDVVFSIISAANAEAAIQALKETQAQADQPGQPSAAAPDAPQPSPTGGTNPNSLSAEPIVPPVPSPAQAVSGAPSTAAAPAATPPLPGGAQTVRTSLGSIVVDRNGGLISQTGVEETPTTGEAIRATAENAAVANPNGANVGQPVTTTPTPATPSEPAKAPPTIAESTPGWKFICPPEDISWETTFQADRVQIFGMNDAPVIGGSKSMRDLTLSNAIVEGFTRGKTVEDKIAMLEDMMRMKMGKTQDGANYVQVPVYKVFASNKVYGDGKTPYERGFFIIKSVKVQEKLRDLSGRTTRALVDISLTQVPAYQVESGRDIAGAFLPSQQSVAGVVGDKVLANTPEIVKGINAANARANSGVNGQGNQGAGGGGGQPSSSSPAAAINPENVRASDIGGPPRP